MIDMLKKLGARHSQHVAIQFVQYGFVAVAAFVVDFGLLFVFTHYLHIYYLLSATMSFLLSLVLNYFLSIIWVFSRSSYSRTMEIVAFTIIGLIGLAMNIGVIWFCTAVFGIYYLGSKLIAVCVVFFWSFIARRYLIFNKSIDKSHIPLVE